MSIDWNWALLVAGALLVLLEVLLGGFAGFDLVLIGSSFVLGGGIGLFAGSPTVGFSVASVLCLVYIVVGRRWVRGRMRHQPVPTNVDAMIGRTAVAIQRITTHEPGQVKVQDEIWRAVPARGTTGPFEPGTEVTVVGVDGVTLQVR